MGEKDIIKLASKAEDKFIELFSEVFGPDKTNKLIIQYPFKDIYGKSRYIDFAVKTDNEKIAIEVDGEIVHNPNEVSNEKYYDDLLRQNSLIFDNWKVYRWTDKQLVKYPDKVKDEIKTFLSNAIEQAMEDYLPMQKGRAFELKEHQEEALEALRKMREEGETIALLYHATGTGKTITAVEDAKAVGGRTLFLAHTKELVEQANEVFHKVWPEANSGIYMGEIKEKEAQIVVGSIQSISQNIEQFNTEDFQYIIIDEAHHSGAESYKKILSHFKTDFILGLTATPFRNDNNDLLDIFKNVAHRMDLKTAIEKGILAEIRCIRIKTNVDISDVRINGIKYDARDLESKLFVPERNQVIVDTYLKFVKNKRTVVFCASVNNAEEVAELFREKGISSEAVSGSLNKHKREQILKSYENGKIQVLCACDLLNEGWDSPKTEVLFMARPTMSKIIYMQQIGRGTRKASGKDYLMVFDFIDNASLFNMPLSMHRMFNLEKYVPGALVFGRGNNKKFEEDLFRKGDKPVELLDLPVDVMDYEYIDLFNWQDKVKEMISQIDFVRKVNVQAETIGKYIREGMIIADLEVPMGNSTFKYFKEETIVKYAEKFGWKLINEGNLKEIFMEFVEKMDMSYSYKPVLLLAMLECVDENGKVLVEDMLDYFIDFYEERKKKGLSAEKKKSMFNEEVVDRKKAKRTMFSNPFKRFEDMNFMSKCKDIEYVEFNRVIWRKLSHEDKKLIRKRCEEALKSYYEE